MLRATLSLLAVSAFLTLASAGVAQAVVINVDFNVSNPNLFGLAGTYSGTAAAPDSGTVWNGLAIGNETVNTASFTSGVLVDSTGATTGTVTTTLTNCRPYDALDMNNNPAGVDYKLMSDFSTGRSDMSSAVGFSINGLPTGMTFNLYLYSQNGGFNSSTTAFTFGAATQTATNSGGNASALVQGGNYVLFTHLSDPGGSISGSFVDAGTGGSAFNGFQLIAETPEPASIGLMACGSLLLLRRRK